MCHFIWASLPASADTECCLAIAKSYHMNWLLMSQGSGESTSTKRSTAYLTNGGECDCGTTLGAAVQYHYESILEHRADYLAIADAEQALLDEKMHSEAAIDLANRKDLQKTAKKLARKGWGKAEILESIQIQENQGQFRQPADKLHKSAYLRKAATQLRQEEFGDNSDNYKNNVWHKLIAELIHSRATSYVGLSFAWGNDWLKTPAKEFNIDLINGDFFYCFTEGQAYIFY